MSFLEKLSNHSTSVLKILVFTVIFVFIIVLMLSNQFRQKVGARWKKHRCNPLLAPFAGFFREPDEPRGYFEFTVDNTRKCTESIFKRFFHAFTEPLREVFKIISNIIKDLVDVLNRFRFHHSITRTLFKEIVGNVATKISNTYAALQFYQSKLLTLINQQKSLLSIMMMFMKAIGITLESLINGPLTALIHFLKVFLIGLLVLLGICLISKTWVPGGWPQAQTLWVLPFPLNVPLMFLLKGAPPVGYSATVPFPEPIPTPLFFLSYLPCSICFHPDTPIQLTKSRMCPIQHLSTGDTILEGGIVISIMKLYVGRNADDIYDYCGVQVTGCHMILEKGEPPIRVKDHPYSKKVTNYNSDWVYCLNTQHACLLSRKHRFADYWETTCPITNLKTQYLIEEAVNDFEKDRNALLEDRNALLENRNALLEDRNALLEDRNALCKENQPFQFTPHQELRRIIQPHLYQVGLHKNTYLKMANGTFKQIKDIRIGDRVLHGGLVTGLISHDSYHLKMYQLGYLRASGTQLIYYKHRWIRLYQHPDASVSNFQSKEECYQIMTESSQLETMTGDKLRDYLEIQSNHPVFDKIHQLNLNSRTQPRFSWKSTIRG